MRHFSWPSFRFGMHRAIFFCWVMLLLPPGLVTPSTASEPSGVKAEGALDGYESHDQFVAHLKRLAESSPCVRMKSLAETSKSSIPKSVFLVTVGHPNSQRADQNRAVLILGSVESNRPLGSELSVRLVERLVQSSEGKKDGGPILSQTTFYIIPRPAPDAYEAFFQKPYQERTANNRPIDDDHDGRFDEDGPDDLNGDGWITMMRVEDPHGTYLPHPTDPRLMLKADPQRNERGRYRLYQEGLDNDHDELFNEDGQGGVAFNRNFTFNYNYFGKEAGPNQVSEPETRAVADAAFDRPNIVAVFSFSAQDNLMKPWKPNPAKERARNKTTLLAADAPYLKQIASRYRAIHGAKDAPTSTVEQGSFATWAYFHFGRLSLTARGWWMPRIEPKPKQGEKVDPRSKEQLGALRWFEKTGVDGFVPWTEVTHPDFPDRKVEVGGFKPFLRNTPPAKELDRLADLHFRWIEELVDSFARLKIEKIKTEPLGGGLYRVTATVTNEGRLPTELRMGAITKKTYPIQVELTVPEDAVFIKGSRRTKLGALAPLGGYAKVTWIVRIPLPDKEKGEPKFKVRAWSPSVGSVKSGE